MSEVFVALGSNIEPLTQLLRAARALRRQFRAVRFSDCFRNAAFGFKGDDFVNAVAAFDTELPVSALVEALHAIEVECGRGPADPKWGPRAIDLDLLLYEELVGSGPGYHLPRPDLTERVYMLGPLAELAPQRRYPPAGPTFGELWAARRAQERASLQRLKLDLNALPR